MEEKNDLCARYKQKKPKKVHRFLQYGRKKMIDVHTVNKKKNKEIEIFAEILYSEYMFIVK